MKLFLFAFTVMSASTVLMASDGLTVKNIAGPVIKLHISDNEGNIFETKEVRYNQSVKMNKCKPGLLLLIEWGEKESDGRPKAVGRQLKACNSRELFTASYELIRESNDWGELTKEAEVLLMPKKCANPRV